MIFVGAHLDQVKAVALVVGDGVGTNQFQFGAHASVNRVVISAELDHGFLSRMQKRDILRSYFGLDQQVIFQRYDFHHVTARLDYAANGVDLQLFDDAVDRRYHRGAAYPVVNGDAGGGDFRQVGAFLIQLLGRVRAKGLYRFVDLAADFIHRRFSARNGEGRGVQRTANFDRAAFETQDFDRRYRTRTHQWRRHVHLLIQQRQAVTKLLLFGAKLGQLLGFLAQLLGQRALLAVEPPLTLQEQRFFVFSHLRRFGDHFG